MSSSSSDEKTPTVRLVSVLCFHFVPDQRNVRIMTTRQTESTSDLRQQANDHIRNTLRHITAIVSAIDVLDSAWRLASERNVDERAALDAARRQLAELLDGSAGAV